MLKVFPVFTVILIQNSMVFTLQLSHFYVATCLTGSISLQDVKIMYSYGSMEPGLIDVTFLIRS